MFIHITARGVVKSQSYLQAEHPVLKRVSLHSCKESKAPGVESYRSRAPIFLIKVIGNWVCWHGQTTAVVGRVGSRRSASAKGRD